MSAAPRIAFALLVCATFAAFFVAQELKSTPPLVQDLTARGFFSPNHDGRFDRARASFQLKRTDDVTATVIDRAGDTVRRLRNNTPLAAGTTMRLAWDGTDASGRLVPDGIYRFRLNLRRQGRAVLLPRNIRKDTTPPVVRVTSIGPLADKVPRPELFPNAKGEPLRVSFQAPGHHKEILVYRTDVRPARPVFDTPVGVPDDARTWSWNGKVDGRRVAPGTYLVVVRARDLAGNIGSSAPIPPTFQYGQPLRGRGGINIRYLTAQALATPVVAGQQASVAVDSVNEHFNWTLRRAGDSQIRKRGHGTRTRVVHFTAPGGKSGLYIFEARTKTRRTAAPLVVQSQQTRNILVVLPVTAWQGTNPLDDDGDGRPNTLGAGLPVRIARPYAGTGLPAQLPQQEALLLAQLDRTGRRYDLTTDVALSRGEGPKLAGHRAVILPGDTRWLDAGVARSLRAFVRSGGNLLSVGTDSLRRSVTLDNADDQATNPQLATSRDLFGARLRPVVREPVSLVNVVDKVELFGGTEGLFSGIDAFEQTVDVRGGAQAIAAAAATQPGDRQVIVAQRLGRGLVIRPGIPDFSAKLRTDPELAAFLQRVWTLLGEAVIASVTALGDFAQTAGVVVAALLAAAALLAGSPRARAAAMLAALVLTPVLLVANIWSTPQFAPLRHRPLLLLAAGGAALVAIAVAALVVHRRPALLALAAAATLPFRVPIESGGNTANLLVPLYFVIAAGVVAYAVPRLRAPRGLEDPVDEEPHRRGALEWLLAATVVLYAAQSSYSSGFDAALAQVIFFYVPFALLYVVLARIDWTPRLAAQCLIVLLVLAVAFVGIGFVEYDRRELLLNPKVISSNQFESYFRVNSLFFDPNIYGRFLVAVMLGLTALLLWARRALVVAGCAAGLALLWAGLVLTLSQSSFTALLAGLAVLGALRWGAARMAALVALLAAAGLVVVLVAPGAVGLDQSTENATSGRSTLVSGGLHLFADKPLEGWGAGAFRDQYRKHEKSSNARASAASHTIPITVAAEQGAGGLALYLALVGVAIWGLLRGARTSIARAAIAAAFVALVVHTLLYAAFLEDPLAWALLAVGSALAPAAVRSRRAAPEPAPPAAGLAAAAP